MEDCIFCKIVNRESPASVVFEDDTSMVIEPIDPISKGHVLVLPKKHFVNMLDTDDETLSHLAVVSKNVGHTVLGKNNAHSMNLLHAAGMEAQQSVFHLHFHIVPRYENDGLDLWFRNSL
ncbi:MAG: HIT domain-containing protein [bacterium]